MPTKICPFCAEEIQEAAILCKHCGMDLRHVRNDQPTTSPKAYTVVPRQKSGFLRQLTRTRIGRRLIWLAVFLIVGVVGAIWESFDTHTTPQFPDISESQLESSLTKSGYSFQSFTDDNGIAGRVGTPDEGWTWVYLMGPTDNLQYVAIQVTFVKGREEIQSNYVVNFLDLFLGNVEATTDIIDWIVEHEDIGQTEFDNVTYGRWEISLRIDRDEGRLLIKLDNRY